jgi:hypothetical protein
MAPRGCVFINITLKNNGGVENNVYIVLVIARYRRREQGGQY